jgi:predicted acylesterase/phospholipase RssA
MAKIPHKAPGPFGAIALSLSGGGYRAAAFHLGSLWYLDRVGILKDVSILSTVSGGTILGAKYAIAAKRGVAFHDFYKEFSRFLQSTDLVKLSLARLGKKSRGYFGYTDLITSMAEVYNKELFSDERFGIFWQKGAIHLKDIIFNATEFRTGIGFRFQKSGSPRAVIGNGNVKIDVKAAQQVRLADITAASSCFPGGFEPIAFPTDFRWPDEAVLPELRKDLGKELPLMDGGVYDNQGIESVMHVVGRKGAKVPGLFIISDTDQPNDDIYTLKTGEGTSALPLSMLNAFGWALMFFSIVACGLLLNSSGLFGPPGEWSWRTLLYVIASLVPLLTTAAIIWLRRKVIALLDRVPKVGSRSWKEIKHLTVDQFADMVQVRLTSLFALTSSIFMKRVRSLVYTLVYQDKKYDKRRVSNLISDLIRSDKEQVISWLAPSPAVAAVARDATDMKTTLWFDNAQQQRSLVACGQFTMCYNILEHIIRRFKDKPENYPAAVRKVYDKAYSDWKVFQADPFVMEK